MILDENFDPAEILKDRLIDKVKDEIKDKVIDKLENELKETFGDDFVDPRTIFGDDFDPS